MNNLKSENEIYKQKYLKYKLKYLELREMIGGGEKTAKNMFDKLLSSQYCSIAKIFYSDEYLLYRLTNDRQILANNQRIPTRDILENCTNNNFLSHSNTYLLPQTYDKSDTIFDRIFNIIKENISNKYIDTLINFYLSDKLGFPNSLENRGRLIDNLDKLQILRNNKKQYGDVPGSFSSLQDLEQYIENNQEKIDEINKTKEEKKRKKETQIKIKEEGEGDANILFDNTIVTVYQPTTENGAKYYGRGTRWCTAANNDNMFNYYNQQGPLYIVLFKNNNNKYQLHFKTEQFMNSEDNPVEFELIRKEAGEEFTNWTYQLINEIINNIIDSNINDDRYSDFDYDRNSDTGVDTDPVELYLTKYAGNITKSDYNMMLKIVMYNPEMLRYADSTLTSNYNFMLELVRQYGYLLGYADSTLKSNYNLVLEAVYQDYNALHYADSTLKSNYDIVLEAVKQNGNALQYADNTLKSNYNIVTQAFINMGYLTQYESSKLKNYREIMMTVLKKNGNLLHYAHYYAKKDYDMVLEAVKQNGGALVYADNTLKRNYNIVLEAVKNYGYALQYADNTLKSNYDIALEAVKQNGSALVYVDDTLKRNYNIVLEAVKQNGEALRYADKTLQSNRDIMLEARKGYRHSYY